MKIRLLFYSCWCLVFLWVPKNVGLADTSGRPGSFFEWKLVDFLKPASGVRVAGNPQAVRDQAGEAVYFDGVDDGLFLNEMPLTGLSRFTVEVILKPDSGGSVEQRFFHSGEVQGDRVLLELRALQREWYFDAFVQSGKASKTLVEPGFKHPLNQWYHVALVVDSGKLSTYIDGQKELEATIDFSPLKSGKTSLGVRLNKQSWFKGTISQICLTPRALGAGEFRLLSQLSDRLRAEVEQNMLEATRFMVEKVSTNGGYVWYYLPDLSRRWGEMEAYKTMIWLQHPGTISMGHLFIDAYQATGDDYYYQAARKAANALIWGQSLEGGWNYLIDFAGDRSLKAWYNTIGKNGWRLEEFQHYYGNATFDDDITSDAARFLLRMYLEQFDPAYKQPLDKAINFILESQYPNGGWPQRYPLRYDFVKQGHPDYTSYYTFNDDVIWENVHFLIQCYLTLGEARFLDAINRGMNFYLLSQDSCGAWGQQLDMKMQVAGARTYEPAAFLPSTTFENAQLLLKFYQYTGDRRFLAGVPKAIEWLEKNRLPVGEGDGEYTHPMFIDVKTGKPVYVHRKGSNVVNGCYYVDDKDDHLLSHYGGKCRINLNQLKEEYNRLSSLPVDTVTKDSPLKVGRFEGEGTPQTYYDLNRYRLPMPVTESSVRVIISSLDAQHRWLIQHGQTSHPYSGEGKQEGAQTDIYASTNVGDETDTSPYRDPSDQWYISTGTYLQNMGMLIKYLNSVKR